MNTTNELQPEELYFSEEKLHTLQLNWHSWPTLRIGEMLCARTSRTVPDRNGEEMPFHVQRSVCFKLSREQLKALQQTDVDWNYLRFYIGASVLPDQQSTVNPKPIFMLILEPVSTSSSGSMLPSQQRFYPLSWSPQSPKDGSGIGTADTEHIAKQTAKLFCRSFCQLRSTEIGDLFEAAINTGVYRLNHFSFRSHSTDKNTGLETTTIQDEIRKKLETADELCIYLGESTAYLDHPYRFRPILTLNKTPISPKDNKNEDDDYPANFEFSIHCPPIC